MKNRAIFSGVIGGVITSALLWLIIYYIWPSYTQEELKSPAWIELIGYLIVIMLIVLTGAISAKWSWARDWKDYVLSGSFSGLLIGCISYNLIGGAGMGLMGNQEILQNLGNVISNENEGTTYIIFSVISTARWVYGGFWGFLIVGIIVGSVGGVLARIYSPNALGKQPSPNNKWLGRLAVYILVLIGFLSYIVSSAVFSSVFDSIKKSIEEANFLSPILSNSLVDLTTTTVALFSMTIALVLYIPLSVTLGWTLSEWRIKKHHFLSYLWLFFIGTIVICNMNSLSFNKFYIIAAISAGIITYVVFQATRKTNSVSLEKITISDWIAFALFVAIIGGAQSFAGITPFSFSVSVITILNIPHFLQNQLVEQSANSQIELLFTLLSSFGLLFMLVNGVIGLIVGWITFYTKRIFFYEGYFENINQQLQSDKLWNESEDMDKKKTTVFVSYSHADSSFVDRLIGDLKKGNIDVWIDKWAIRVGDSITDKVNEGIGSSDFLIIVLSTSSVNSKWVREEINTALIRNIEQGKRAYILPLLIEDCDLPPLLSHRRYANFKDDYTKGYLELVEAIEYRANNT